WARVPRGIWNHRGEMETLASGRTQHRARGGGHIGGHFGNARAGGPRMNTPESVTAVVATTVGTKYTRDQALESLARHQNTSKTVREIAAIWGWSRSTAHDLMSRCPTGQDALSDRTERCPTGQDALSDRTEPDKPDNGASFLVPKLTTDDGRPFVGVP